MAKVHFASGTVVVHDSDRRAAPCGKEISVHSTQPYRLDFVLSQGGQQISVEQTRIHHLGDFERPVVRHPAPGDELGLLPQPPAHGAGLRAASMHDDEPDAKGVKQGKLGSHSIQDFTIREHVAAEFDDEDMVAVGADVAEGAFEPGDAFGGVDGHGASMVNSRWSMVQSRGS
jgi:hypothetical protein